MPGPKKRYSMLGPYHSSAGTRCQATHVRLIKDAQRFFLDHEALNIAAVVSSAWKWRRALRQVGTPLTPESFARLAGDVSSLHLATRSLRNTG